MSDSRILLFDLATFTSRSLARALERAGFAVDHTTGPDEALATLDDGPAALLLDPSLEGGALWDAILDLATPPPVFLFDDFGGVRAAPPALVELAEEVIERPADEEGTVAAVRQAIDRRGLEQENHRLRLAVNERYVLGGLVSSDVRMHRVFETVRAVADSRASILVQGESGTGKTVLARAVHELSGRPDAPFVVVNCGALPSSLLESELFGHVKGAFTGAVRDRAGKFESADGGTIFLDEIATAPPELQVKLLRVLEEGRFERVGDEETRTVDVRLIAAANEDLEEQVEKGEFRADLFYRINVVRIDVPSLHERPGDIPLLAERFLARFRERHGRPVEGIDPQAMSRLCSEPWPGNVRQLENAIERAVLLTRAPILGISDLWPGEPDPAATNPAAGASPTFAELPLGPLKAALEIPERWLIRRALRLAGGSRKEAARTLGINRTTLFNKMRKYHLLSFPAQIRGEAPGVPRSLDQAS